MHLLDLLEPHPPLQKLVFKALAAPSGRSHRVGGAPQPTWAPLTAFLARKVGKTLLFIAPNSESAENTLRDLLALRDHNDGDTLFFPSPDRAMVDEEEDRNASQDRLAVLDALHREGRAVVVTTAAALAHPTLPPRELLQGYDELKVGQKLVREEFLQHLAEAGYERVEEVETPGQFAVRGGIVDFYPPAGRTPVRLELFGDEIDSLRTFDAATQRSTEKLKQIRLTPPRELYLSPLRGREIADELEYALMERKEFLKSFPDEVEALDRKYAREVEHLRNGAYFQGLERYRGLLYPEHPTLFEHLPPDTLVLWADPERAEGGVGRLLDENGALHEEDLLPLPPSLVTYSQLRERGAKWNQIEVRTGEDEAAFVALGALLAPTFQGKLDSFAGFIKEKQDQNATIVLSTAHARRVREILADAKVRHVHLIDEMPEPVPGSVLVMPRRLTGGFALTPPPGAPTSHPLYLFCDNEMFGWRAFQPRSSTRGRKKSGKRARFSTDASPLGQLAELKEGDYVVHIQHGIARYGGVVRREIGGAVNEYLALEYDGADRLYVPVGQLDRIQKFLGGDASVPSLSPLKGNSWEKAKTKAREEAMKAAQELAGLYKVREAARKVPVGPDTPWQREMESAFPFEETPSQLQAIKDTKSDQETELPMDRLVCGDVGFGKTEVAVRAAFKAVQDGRQVAVLVPTTILAQQHAQTFAERMAAYPIRIEQLSRFKTPSEARKIIEDLRAGVVDIVVGTHKLLQSDVLFKNLGLVVVDEEQRFGVMQKERLKEMRAEVDILTMSATPIPRTLQMALGGLREISLITDPPIGRLSVRTYVSPLKDNVLRAAIERELEREGQVYYVHNRVESIARVAEGVQKLVPHARIGVGHGQMGDEELEQVMLDFMNGRTDILIATTIIENGLDLPNANTLICDHAENLGLSQMYQLRGRVGRSPRQAYAYFFHGSRGHLPKEAEDRFAALQENTDLGAGFRIALRDLEIRGSGDVLGLKQSGSIQGVGLELYSQYLAEAVQTTRGERAPRYLKSEELPEADLPLPAFLPPEYIADEADRLDFYRKMTGARDLAGVKAIGDELRDRFGPLPPQAFNLLRVLKVRVQLLRAKLRSITKSELEVLLRLKPGDLFTDSDLAAAYAALNQKDARSRQHISLRKLEGLAINTRALNGAALLRVVEILVEALAEERERRFGG